MPIPPFVQELRELVGTRELWLPAVTAVVCRGEADSREVLLTRRADNGEWAPITGILDPGEEPAVGAAREAYEEAAVEISVDRLASVGASPRITHANGDLGVYLDVTFVCSWVGGEPRVNDDENLEVGWWPVAALPPMREFLRERITHALSDGEAARFEVHHADVSPVPVLDRLETERLVLRRRRVDEAAIYRQLWTERDPRVPPHRRIDPDGRPSVEDVAGWIRAEREESRPGVLAVEVKDTGEVIGYCGVVFHGNGSPDDPELAYELLRSAQGCGYATEAAQAVVTWASEAGSPRLWATVRDWNVASRRVLEKLGFRETGQVGPDDIHGDSLLTVREL